MQKHKLRRIAIGAPLPLRPEPPAKPELVAIIELQANEIARLNDLLTVQATRATVQENHIAALNDRNTSLQRVVNAIKRTIGNEGATLVPSQSPRPARKGRGL